MLDLKTLIAVQTANDVVIASCFVVLVLSARRHGYGLWAVGHALQALVGMWIYLASAQFNYATLSLITLLLAASNSLFISAQAKMVNAKLPLMGLAIPPLLLFFVGISQTLSKSDYIILVALVLAVKRLASSSLLLQWVRPNRSINVFTAVCFAGSGLMIPILASLNTIPEPWGIVSLLLFIVLSSTSSLGLIGVQLQKAEVLNRTIAAHDGITGLLNRRTFLHMSQRELARSLRQHDPLTLMLIEIDSFRSINAHYGESGGNSVLMQLSRTLERTLRKHDLIGRYSGTHFCAILSGTTVKGAARLAERLRNRIEGLVVQPDGIRFTISVGISERLPDELSTEDLVARAEAALTLARAAGRNRVSTGTPEEHATHDETQPVLPLLDKAAKGMEHIKVSARQRRRPISLLWRQGKAS